MRRLYGWNTNRYTIGNDALTRVPSCAYIKGEGQFPFSFFINIFKIIFYLKSIKTSLLFEFIKKKYNYFIIIHISHIIIRSTGGNIRI